MLYPPDQNTETASDITKGVTKIDKSKINEYCVPKNGFKREFLIFLMYKYK